MATVSAACPAQGAVRRPSKPGAMPGQRVCFSTDATRLTVGNHDRLQRLHMPATGQSGLALYGGAPIAWPGLGRCPTWKTLEYERAFEGL